MKLTFHIQRIQIENISVISIIFCINDLDKDKIKIRK
ncbi:hypothetical protein Cop2CBH44_26810 [Coprobacter secundus subsp. similis]|uniref:Uncharacterized protein n=1 Tax=Coprobacter secundus subsp. similis TaxID=2751153 RepID=A0A7G1I1Q0_9BACT|nr:hypothetical protein Cop2CBH44_26810 [Coprobacter secundus subsp. similis]